MAGHRHKYVTQIFDHTFFASSFCFTTPHAHARAGGYVIAGVRIYIYRYVCGQKIFLAIDSPLQTFAVGLLVKFIATRAPERLSSSSKSRIFLYNAHFALFVRMDDTITRNYALVSIVV